MRSITDTRTNAVYEVEKYRVKAGKVSFEAADGALVSIPVSRALIGNRICEDSGQEELIEQVAVPEKQPALFEAQSDVTRMEPTGRASVEKSARNLGKQETLGHQPQGSSDIKPSDNDRSWKNAKVKLSSTPRDAIQTFYRARLEMAADEESDTEIWPQIVMVLQEWLEEKEGRWDDRGKENLLIPLTSNLKVYSKRYKKMDRKCWLSPDMVNGAFSHECASTYLRTFAEIGDGSPSTPQYWVLEYIERDPAKGWRRWVTNVGITALGHGVYAVNAFVGYYDDPTYVYETEKPMRNVPRFIGELIEIDKCRVSAGSSVLTNVPQKLDAQSLPRFVDDLTNADRNVPLVVIASERNENGHQHYYIDPTDLAKLLRGVAVVYTLNRNDEEIESAYKQVFGREGTPAYLYRVEPGALRVYWPKVDLVAPEQYAYAQHRFIPGEVLIDCDASYVMQNIAQGISRAHTRKHGEVINRESIEAQRVRLSRENLIRGRDDLAQKLQDVDAKLKEAEERVRTAHAESEKLSELADENELLLEGYNQLISRNKDLQDFIENANVGREAELSERVSELEANEDRLFDEMSVLEEREKAANKRLEELKPRLFFLEKENSRLRNMDSRSQHLADLVLDMGSYISDASAAIMLAKQAFGDRLCFLHEACSSAEEFKGDAGDMFTALVKMAEVLWEMRFAEGKTHIDESEYKSRTGYEIAFSEGKQTNRTPEFRKLRTRDYRGREIDISAHVKGGNKRDGLLRIHFHIDNEEQLIVIGHCGNHLKSAGTPYL